MVRNSAPRREVNPSRSKPKAKVATVKSEVNTAKAKSVVVKRREKVASKDKKVVIQELVPDDTMYFDEQSNSSIIRNLTVYKHAYEDPNWQGNEDDAGSVESGLLEEDFCCECGASTLTGSDWKSVIICDICEGEYHLQCLGLDRIPRATFICPPCMEEANEQRHLKFNVSDVFRVSLE